MIDELNALLKKPKLLITMLGVALIPALYNLSFLGSMWDPYGQVDRLPVAVVNHDKTAKLGNKTFSIGKDMVDSMSKSKDLDYHFVTAQTAQKGLQKGDYYMVMTLPNDLSQKATTLLNDSPEKLTINYQTSKGHGMIASKMSEAVMDKLKERVASNVTKTYTSSVFKSLTNLQSGLQKASKGSQEIADGASNAAANSQLLANHLGKLSSSTRLLEQGSQQLSAGLDAYTGGVSQLTDGFGQLSAELPIYLNGVNRLTQGSYGLTNALTQIAQVTKTSPEQASGIQTLIKGLPQLNQAIQDLNNNVSGLQAFNVDKEGLEASLRAISLNAQQLIAEETAEQQEQLTALQRTKAFQSLTAEQQAELSGAITQNPSGKTNAAKALLSGVQDLSTKLTSMSMENQTGQLAQLQQGVKQLASQSGQILPESSRALLSLSTGISSVNQAVVGQLLTGSNQLSQGLGQLDEKNDDINTGISSLSKGVTALDNQSSQLTSGSYRLSDGLGELVTGADQLTQGGQKLSTGLSTLSSGALTLNDSLTKAEKQLSLVSVTPKNAQAVASPLQLRATDKDHVKTNGIAMAPYMIAVSLMVVALSTNVIFASSLSGRPVTTKRDWAKQKLVINGFISTLSSIILYIAIQFLGFEANDQLKTLAVIILSGWTLMALVTALVGWDNRYGSFAALVLLLLQVGSSGGSYPIELSGPFFRMLNPLLPMSYVVSGLRQTISLSGNVTQEVLVLLSFCVAFMGLALLIYRPQQTETTP
ncbi:YhgE/Pip domain-containing protein [Streptococcus phocae]|uniref:ABC-2 type transporter transmembrane domain-containing protein n=1 Tax=Streptococcus phocae TaxID=119224 RepID=A0A0P6S0K4_9STRE|nr:YhgE/Pip domain-containing protein [Streptococcus phocae]KPJ21956.1 hypothetical protein AKK44_07125 [Streptococcus phocae]